jgi:hypothetical protein
MDNNLWVIASEVAKENQRLVLTSSLTELAQKIVARGKEKGLAIKQPSPSHMSYILKSIGYAPPVKGSHKGFVYRHKVEHE